MYYFITGCTAALILISWILIDPKKPKLNVKNELVVITGGTSGLGLEIALECLHRGAKVILLARKIIDVKSHDQLKQFQGQVRSISCDVTKREDLDRTRNGWIIFAQFSLEIYPRSYRCYRYYIDWLRKKKRNWEGWSGGVFILLCWSQSPSSIRTFAGNGELAIPIKRYCNLQLCLRILITKLVWIWWEQ